MSPHHWNGTDLELDLHVQPGARRTGPAGAHGGAIKLRVAAPPVEGAANDALLAFLAASFQVPRRQCALLSGEASRRKRVRITSPDRAHAERVLASWLQTSS